MANIAVIQTGGKQYIVRVGDTLNVEKLDKKEGSKIKLDPLLVSDEVGKAVKVGTPTVKGASVSATVLETARADKVTVIKYKAKVRYQRKYGHRQPYTAIQINDIKA